MSVTQKDIMELNDIIQKMNSFSNETERDQYMQNTVEKM